MQASAGPPPTEVRLAEALSSTFVLAGGAGEGGARPLLRSRAVIEWPVRMRGVLYLAPGEIRFVRERGLLRRRREEVLRVSVEQIKDVRFAGLLSRKIAPTWPTVREPPPDMRSGCRTRSSGLSRVRELKGAAPSPRRAEG